MGAKGPHDDFETARKTIIAAYANFNLDQDVDAVHRKLADDFEYVTRFGTFKGPDKYLSDIVAQLEKWNVENEIEDIVDAGDGALIVLSKFLRKDPDSGKVEWKAWPAVVMRVYEGKMAFFEGYVDRREALAEYGVEQD